MRSLLVAIGCGKGFANLLSLMSIAISRVRLLLTSALSLTFTVTLRETRVTGLLAPSLDSAWSFEFAATRILEDLPLLLERQDQHLVEAHTCVLLVGSKGASDSPLRELLLTILIRVMVRPHRGLKMVRNTNAREVADNR